MHKSEGYVLGVSRGHDSSICLMKNGELIFYLQEERACHIKRDSAPIASILKLVEQYPEINHIDRVIIVHTNEYELQMGDWDTDPVAVRVLKKYGIDVGETFVFDHFHHLTHALSAFFRSPFDEASLVVADGAGSYVADTCESISVYNFTKESILKTTKAVMDFGYNHDVSLRAKKPKSPYQEETSTVSTRNLFYPAAFIRLFWEMSIRKALFRGLEVTPEFFAVAFSEFCTDHQKCFSSILADCILTNYDLSNYLHFLKRTSSPLELNYPLTSTQTLLPPNTVSFVKTYEMITTWLGFDPLDGGKVMGLAPYGNKDPDIDTLMELLEGSSNIYVSKPDLFFQDAACTPLLNKEHPIVDRIQKRLAQEIQENDCEYYETSIGKNLAYLVQEQSQVAALNHLIRSFNKTKNRNIVLTGGYALNCTANYFYLDYMNKYGLNLFADPIANDSGTSIGAAILGSLNESTYDKIKTSMQQGLYLGPSYTKHTKREIHDHLQNLIDNGMPIEFKNVAYEEVVNHICDGEIVALFQGRSEAGPRALGNRSLLFDPTRPNGKEEVNRIKRREFFRPFAGSILEEDAADWFDLKGMESSPYMMYAVKCVEGKEKFIPSIVHEDGSCRIQTVNKTQNYHFYQLIKEFKHKTDVPILFNTSFNLAGDPLVETLPDAINTLLKSDIKYLFLPDYEMLVHVPLNLYTPIDEQKEIRNV